MATAAYMTESHVLPGGYAFVREIGKGSFARIYEGTTPEGGRVAIKMLRHPSPMARKRFLREIKVLRALPPNRHVVGYIDSGETDDDTPFLVLELLRGTTLASVLATGRRFSEEAACSLMMQLCDAFGELHKLGVTHGDIKPTNIMLTRGETAGDEAIIAKLLDFGLVRDTQGLLRLFEDWRVLEGFDFHEDLDTGVVAGTAEYIAPEILSDARLVDRSRALTDTPADVFGLGVIFHVLLTGRSPWPFAVDRTRPFKRQVRTYLESRFTRPLERPPGVSDEVWSIIAKALSENPRLRQGDARALHADVSRFVQYGVGIPEDLDTQETVLANIEPDEGETTGPPPPPAATRAHSEPPPPPAVMRRARVKTATLAAATPPKAPRRDAPKLSEGMYARSQRTPAQRGASEGGLSPVVVGVVFTAVVTAALWFLL